MLKSKLGEALHLANVRQQIITHCESLPQIVETHGSNSLATVVLTVGRCFAWIGPTLDNYSIVQPLPGAAPLLRVADIGERLRVLGLGIMHKPTGGELERTNATLKRQVELLRELATLQAERSAQ